MPVTSKGKYYLISHLILIGISLFVSGYIMLEFPSTPSLTVVIIGELVIVIVILLSLADYLDIIEWRKSVVRHTKCCVCGATDEDGVSLTDDDDESNSTIKEKFITNVLQLMIQVMS